MASARGRLVPYEGMTAPTAPSDPTVVQNLPVEEMRFDPRNPRRPHTVDGRDEQAVLEWMLNDESLLELMGSIAAQGYFSGEPVLAAPSEADGDHIVVEGNRRLAAVLLLREPQRAPIRKQAVEAVVREAATPPPETLPALVFASRDEILDYLGYRHVTGIREWDPLAKARYVQQLRERAAAKGDDVSHKRLARMIGSRSDYISRLLTGLQIYERIVDRDFYGLKGVNEDAIQFSILTTALSYEKIAEFLHIEDDDTGNVDDSNLSALVEWVFKRDADGRTVLGESRNLGELAAVVSSDDARRALEAGSRLNDAALLTDAPLKAFRKAVNQALDKLRLARTMTHRISEPHARDLTLLEDLFSQARDLLRTMRAARESDDVL